MPFVTSQDIEPIIAEMRAIKTAIPNAQFTVLCEQTPGVNVLWNHRERIDDVIRRWHDLLNRVHFGAAQIQQFEDAVAAATAASNQEKEEGPDGPS